MYLATTDRPSPLMDNFQVQKLYMELQIEGFCFVFVFLNNMYLLSGYAGS